MDYRQGGASGKSQKILSFFKFPRELQGSVGVIEVYEIVKQKFSNDKVKRFVEDEGDILESADNIHFAVSTQWGIGNIGKIIEVARKEGYEIQEK